MDADEALSSIPSAEVDPPVLLSAMGSANKPDDSKRHVRPDAGSPAEDKPSVRLTARGGSTAAAGVVLLTCGLSFGATDLIQGGIAILSLLAVALGIAWWRSRKLVVRRCVSPTMVSVGEPAFASLELLSGRTREPAGQRSAVQLDTSTRGVFLKPTSSLWFTDLFGVLRWMCKSVQDVPQSLVVYPVPRLPTRASHSRHDREDPPASLRRYRTGDELRRVHWPSSISRGHAMVAEQPGALQSSSAILVDLRPHVHTADSFERALSLATGLLAPGADGSPRRLLTTSGTDFGPLATTARWRSLLKTLATTSPGPGASPEAMVNRHPAIRRCKQVVIVTTNAGCPTSALRSRGARYLLAEEPAEPIDHALEDFPGPLEHDSSAPKPILPSSHASMAPRQGPSRILALTGRLWLSATAAISLGALLLGHSWVVPFGFAALGPHLTSLLKRSSRQNRLTLSLKIGVPLAGIAISIATAAVLSSGWTLGSPPIFGDLIGLVRSLSELPRDIDLVGVPAPALKPLLAGSALLLGMASTLTELLAHSRRTFLAVLPPAWIIAFGALEQLEHQPPLASVALTSAALIGMGLTAACSPAPLGLIRARLANGKRTLAPKALAACCCIGIAALAAPIALRATGGPLLSLRSNGSAQLVSINPTVSLAPELAQVNGPVLFSVQSPVPDYWRLTTLDRLTPGGFSIGPPSTPASPSRALGENRVAETFHFVRLSSKWLPVGGIVEPPIPRSASWKPSSGTLDAPLDQLAGPGTTYEVIADTKTPTFEELASATLPVHPPTIDLYVPKEPRPVVSLAHALRSGTSDPYLLALSIQDYLRTHESYDLRPSPGPGNQLERFLFVTHEGYCQQFAGAFGVLARLDGLPTRLAVGFTPGRLGPHDTYLVNEGDVHTWPEVLFAGLGWVRFEPTPGRGAPGDTSYTGLEATQVGSAGARSVAPVVFPRYQLSGGQPTTPSLSAELPGTLNLGHETSGRSRSELQTPLRPSPSTQLLWKALIAAIGLMALAGLLGRSRPIHRARKLRVAQSDPPARAPTDHEMESGHLLTADRDSLLASWHQALEQLEPQLGPPLPGDTPRIYAGKARAILARESAQALADLAELVGQACYGPYGS